MSVSASTLDNLPPAQRLALSYARGLGRQRLLGFFALDARLAGIVRNSREPMLAQLRLAWWREQLCAEAPAPAGEPLLELLKFWGADRPLLAGLADGWEGLTGEAPLALAPFELLAQARGKAFAAIGGDISELDSPSRMGRNWALADLSARLSHPQERDLVRSHALEQDWAQARLPRSLRPLAMMHALAARNLVADKPVNALGPAALAAMIRIGLLGR